MLIAIICTDKPGSNAVRLANRAAHLEHIRNTGVVAQAGPFLNAEGDMCGSLIILDVADMGAAQEWAANDPYAKAGLFADLRIEEWKRVVG